MYVEVYLIDNYSNEWKCISKIFFLMHGNAPADNLSGCMKVHLDNVFSICMEAHLFDSHYGCMEVHLDDN